MKGADIWNETEAPEFWPSTQPSDGITILAVAFPYAPVGPRAVGGAEVVCSHVEAGAVAAGYRSVVVAHEASQPAGTLYGTHVPDSPLTEDVRAAVEADQQRQIDRACREHPVALVHMHGLDFHRYRIPEHLPVLVTLHLPPAWYPETIWDLPERFHLVCVSSSQGQACPERARSRLRTVQNGVPLPEKSTLRTAGKYALMLARICPEKNLHIGMDAARHAGMPLVLAGEVFPYPEHQSYFEAEIRPRLSVVSDAHSPRSSQIADAPGEPASRFLGAVTGGEKQRLLTRAACLLMPSLAEETSSLVSMEALAAGIPVIGMRVGAMDEVVDEGRTGFLITPGGNSTAQMADALRKLHSIDRGSCRATAEARFPLQRMTNGYVELYRLLALPVEHRTVEEPGLPALAEELDLTSHMVRTEAEWLALIPEWTALWSRDPRATPFQHPAWLAGWWRQFGGDGELAAVAVRHRANGALHGYLPAYVYQQPERGERILLLMGAGTTDYLDGLWGKETTSAARCVVEAFLREPGTLCDAVAWMQLRAESPFLAACRAADMLVEQSESCSVIPIDRALPPKIRLNLRRYQRRAALRGDVGISICSQAGEALSAFEKLVILHGRRWEGRGEAGVLHDPRVLAHHREAIPELLAAGLLRMFCLTVNNELVGVLYGLASPAHVQERSLFLYLIGFDEVLADVSPGTLLLGAAWTYARDNRFFQVDLLRGGEQYKQLWGAETRATYGATSEGPECPPA